MKTTKILLSVIISFSLCTGIKAQVLDVKEVFQEMDQWCWAGVSDCFLDYYGCPYPQCEIVDFTRTVAPPGDFGYVNVCMDRSGANRGKYINGAPGTVAEHITYWVMGLWGKTCTI